MGVRENISIVEDALESVKGHCMCAKFEDNGAQFRVIYPAGMILDGVQATYQNCGKKVALDRMLNAMERHWKESGI